MYKKSVLFVKIDKSMINLRLLLYQRKLENILRFNFRRTIINKYLFLYFLWKSKTYL